MACALGYRSPAPKAIQPSWIQIAAGLTQHWYDIGMTWGAGGIQARGSTADRRAITEIHGHAASDVRDAPMNTSRRSPRRTSARLVVLTMAVISIVALSCDDGQSSLVAEPSSSPTPTASPSAPRTPTPEPAPTSSRASRPHDAGATVVSVIDGDTVRVVIDGREEPVRLIGIDAPERFECYSAEATDRLAQLVAERDVILVRDTSDRDDFDRLLRYVYVDGVLVNDLLVREGYAIARRYEPDTSLSELLERSEASALVAGRGLWAAEACGPAAEGAVEIVSIHYDAPGDDNENLNGEWVEVRNGGPRPLDMTGWMVKDESASHRFAFPDAFVLEAGATVRLHTGCGTATLDELYWCNVGSAVWNNGGDTVFVLDPAGNIAMSRSY